MGLAGLLLTGEGSPAERARLADVQTETLDLLLAPMSEGTVFSPTLRLAAIRQAIASLHRWCPSLREAEKVAARNALCLASASLGLDRIVRSAGGGPDLNCGPTGSWDEFVSAARLDPQDQENLVTALDIKRRLLRLTASLEREAEVADVELKRRNELANLLDLLHDDALTVARARSSALSSAHRSTHRDSLAVE